MNRSGVACGVLVLLLAGVDLAGAQSNFQLWGTVVADWVKSDRLSVQLDAEPEVLVDDSTIERVFQ